MSQLNVNTIAARTGTTVSLASGHSATEFGGIVKLAQASATNSNTDLTFDNFVDNTLYTYYKFTVENVTATSSGASLNAHWRTSGGADISDTYYNAYYERDLESGETDATGKTNNDHLNIWGGQNTTAAAAFYGEGSFWCPDNSVARFQITASLQNSGGDSMWAERYSMTSSVTGVKGIRFYMNTGTVATGTVTIYGVKR